MSEESNVRPGPEGWTMHTLRDTFSYLAGPFYFREDPAIPGVGFYSEPHHANMAGVIHGGALMTLADMALFNICFRAVGRLKALTLSLNGEFLSAGPIGEFIEATGDYTGGGKSLLFARGLVTARGKPLMSFSGTLKRVE